MHRFIRQLAWTRQLDGLHQLHPLDGRVMVTDGRVMVLDGVTVGVTAGVVETIGVEAGVTGEGGNTLHKHITMKF
jgi:hypothetical protein